MNRTPRAAVRVVAAAGVSAVLLAACSTRSTTSMTTSQPSPRLGALSTGLEQLVGIKGGPPGAIAVVQTGAHPRVLTAGVGDLGTQRAIGARDTVRIASISKAFNGAVALALVSQGRLSLTDTIGKVTPGLPAQWAAVTLAQLLHHTSGVPDYIKSPAFLGELRTDPRVQMTPTQLLGFVATEPLAFTPGSRYEYSDSDNIVVGLMIEAVTDQPYQSALARDVTTPLGLDATTLPGDVNLREPYIHGYDVEEGKAPEDVSTSLNPALAWASGGMVSTPAELNRFMRGYVAGQLFDAAVRRAQLRFVPGSSGPPGPGTNSAGLAIFRYQTPCGTVYGHTGNFPGYTLFAASNDDGTRSVAIIVNEQLNDRPVTAAFTKLRQVDELGVCAALEG